MAVDPVPYVVRGARHSADVFRQALHDSTGGSEGISTPTSFHVRQTATPSGNVRVRPGGATILNSYGGEGQSYGVRNASETTVAVPPSDSTGPRSWFVIVRISDPQFAGQPPVDPEEGPYTFLECVPQSESITDPHLKLAAVVVPASTATITNDMITSLRELAQPKSKPAIRARALTAIDTETLTSTGEAGEWFPNAGGEQRIFIPEWATRAIIEATWIQINERAGNSFGWCWVEFGPGVAPSTRQYSTQKMRWNATNANDAMRNNWIVADDRPVAAAIRGTEQVFVMKAQLESAVNNDARPQLDGGSAVSMRVTFLEVPDISTS